MLPKRRTDSIAAVVRWLIRIIPVFQPRQGSERYKTLLLKEVS
jgi:hypothetical protein